jgi:cysteinyl-tRNA synthetase
MSIKIKKEFNDALMSDFNTPLALGVFFKFVKELNSLAASEGLTSGISNVVLPILKSMIEVLGLKITEITDKEKTIVEDLIKKRNMFREQKQYQKADEVRKQISDMGIVLIDHKTKTLLLKQEKISMEV